MAALVPYDETSAYWNPYAAVFLLFCGFWILGCAVVLKMGPKTRRRLGIAPYDERSLRLDQQLTYLLGPALVGLSAGVGWFLGRDIGYFLLALMMEATFALLTVFHGVEQADPLSPDERKSLEPDEEWTSS